MPEEAAAAAAAVGDWLLLGHVTASERSVDSVVTAERRRRRRALVVVVAGGGVTWVTVGVALVTEKLMSASSSFLPALLSRPRSGALLMVVAAVHREARGRGGHKGAPHYKAGDMVQRLGPWAGVWQHSHGDM